MASMEAIDPDLSEAFPDIVEVFDAHGKKN
jgi:hypothetical protein